MNTDYSKFRIREYCHKLINNELGLEEHDLL